MGDASTIILNGEPYALPPGGTLSALLAALELPAEWVLVELNGEPVPRDRYGATRLAAGDRLELATPMAGG
jgi:thiamine biosynthesis protein ThiS